MQAKTFGQLLNGLPIHVEPSTMDAGDIQITGVTDDNRKVQPGNIFVAYQGVAVDGHKFIPDAIRRGAVAVVCERPLDGGGLPCVMVPNGRQALAYLCAAWHDFPGRSMVMIGVTGTDGKTTTSNILFSILKAARLKAGIISTVNAVIGERVLDTGLHTTTPDADEIQDYLAQMRDAGMTHCVLEVTSHGLAQYRVDGCDFDVAVVTNITHEHLDLHGSYEAYRAAKARLFEMVAYPPYPLDKGESNVIPPLSKGGLGGVRAKPAITKTAVLNADDAFSFDYLRAIAAPRQIAYTRDVGQAVSAYMPRLPYMAMQTVSLANKHYAPDAMYLTANTPRGPIDLKSSLIGDYNASNILAAVSAALALDIPGEAIQQGVAAMPSVPGRMERINLGQPFTAIVDFAHTPNALEQQLRTLREITPGKLVVVFGCAGERDVQKRPMMGRVAAMYADHVVLTAEDPRREDLATILDQIEAGIEHSTAAIHRVPDRGAAIRFACSLAGPGDTVVSCGKGHEQSMCFGTTETPWDDREAMRAAVRERLGIRD